MHVNAAIAFPGDCARDVVANAEAAMAFALALAQRASVSAVSPLWLMAKTSVSPVIGVLR